MSRDIVLCALNARYIHSSLALRSLHANLGDLRDRATICEFTISQRSEDIAEALLAAPPQIVGLSVAIWNARQCLELAQLLKALAPEITLVLGGPEVSHEPREQPLVGLADYVIAGEGELAFRQLCEALLSGERPARKFIVAEPPDLSRLALPYGLYLAEDIAQRVIYVEGSRGCPYRCAFCLSALDPGVRRFDEASLFVALSSLLERGARRFKFVDRTFNLRTQHAVDLLDFFAQRPEDDLFLHFEAVPDRLSEPLIAALERVGPERVQLELGVQSLDPETLARIDIQRDQEKVLDNLERFASLGVHTHADLIGGLPGESLESFARGFDRLWATGVDEIQLGILKRLRGAPIADQRFAGILLFSAHPPYEVLRSDALPFEALQELKRVAYLWDRLGNSGNFASLLASIEKDGSLFWGLWELTRWIYAREGRVHAIALDKLAVLLWQYLSAERALPAEQVAHTLIDEYRLAGRKLPKALRPFAKEGVSSRAKDENKALPARQARHRRGHWGSGS